MMNIETLRDLSGWCLVINGGILLVTTVSLCLLRGWASSTHAKMFGVDEAWIRQSYFTYLANFKIAVIMLNLAPWIALNLMNGG